MTLIQEVTKEQINAALLSVERELQKISERIRKLEEKLNDSK